MFGDLGGRSILCTLLGRWNPDFNTSPNAPVRVWVDTDYLPAESIKVVVEGRSVDDSKELCVLADDIIRQWNKEKIEPISKPVIAPRTDRLPAEQKQEVTQSPSVRLTMDPDKVRIEVVLDRTFEYFGLDAEAQLLETLRQLLNTTRQLHAIDRRRGSVVLTLELTADEAIALIAVFRAGALAFFGVSEVRHVSPEDRSKHGGYWSPSDTALGDCKPRSGTAIDDSTESTYSHNDNLQQLRQMEEHFRQSQKMEALGRLASGVAHDFNNILTIIRGYSELLSKGLSTDDPRFELVSGISEAGERAASLTNQLLASARKTVPELKTVNINELCKETGRLLERLIGEDVRLVLAIASLPIYVRADPGQLEQVLLNMAVNARDAMPAGGRLVIETREIELEGMSARSRGLSPGKHVELVVTDTGMGMTADVKERAFEPFFTTKPLGKGTGLGLSVVHGVVTQSGGHIGVSSEPGLGAKFTVTLPVVANTVIEHPSHAVPTSSGGSETVLVLEDEAKVRGIVRVALQERGYNVLEAGSGTEAFQVVKGSPRAIDLLVADVVMPGMNGREIAEALCESRPQLKVLYVSGYPADDLIRRGIRESEVAFLPKPFTPSLIAEKVREVLDS